MDLYIRLDFSETGQIFVGGARILRILLRFFSADPVFFGFRRYFLEIGFRFYSGGQIFSDSAGRFFRVYFFQGKLKFLGVVRFLTPA